MMLQRWTTIVVLGNLVLISCTPGKEKEHIYTLKKTSSIFFTIDSTITPQTIALFKFDENDREYLSYLNEPENEIIIFDIQGQRIEYRIRCDVEGPNGVGRIGGYSYLNKDTIIINPRAGKRLYFINNRGQVYERIDYAQTKEGKPTGAAHYSSTVVHTPLIRLGDNLYLTNFPDGNYSFLDRQTILEHPLGKIINFKTKEVVFTTMKYPDIWRKFKCSPVYSCIYDGKNFVYLFRYYEHILITHDFHDLKTVKVTSRYFDQFRGVKLPPENMQTYIRELLQSPCFLNLIYDSYRKFYYIFVYPGMETDTSLDVLNIWKDLPFFSIIILNEQFKKVGEQMMPSNTYNLKNFFISREGLCLSVNHPMNRFMDENRLVFDVFLPVADKGKSD